tara:strand:- start:8988 stop:9386 length:399 start_codon:yes stop_codon:yes gene_type:complete
MPVNKKRTLKRRNFKKTSTKKLKRISRGGTKTPRYDDSTLILDPLTGNTMFFPNKEQAIKYSRERSKQKRSPKKTAAKKIKSLMRRKSSISSRSSTSSDSDKTKDNSPPKKSTQNTIPSPLTPLLGTLSVAP